MSPIRDEEIALLPLLRPSLERELWNTLDEQFRAGRLTRQLAEAKRHPLHRRKASAAERQRAVQPSLIHERTISDAATLVHFSEGAVPIAAAGRGTTRPPL